MKCGIQIADNHRPGNRIHYKVMDCKHKVIRIENSINERSLLEVEGNCFIACWPLFGSERISSLTNQKPSILGEYSPQHLMMGNDSITLLIDAVVCLALLVTVIFAKVVGGTLPLIAKALKLDPAVMASPFITTIVDALSLLVYFLFAQLLLGV